MYTRITIVLTDLGHQVNSNLWLEAVRQLKAITV